MRFPTPKITSQRGFSLVELMIVVAIIGILSSLAIPNFQRFQAKAKQSEAKTNLSHIYALQQSYFGDNDTYYPNSGWNVNLAPLGFQIQGKTRYIYYVQGGSNWFQSAANAQNNDIIRPGCPGIDQWFVDSNNSMWFSYNCAEN